MHCTEVGDYYSILRWNDLVKGADEGNGWLRVEGPDIPKTTDQQQSDGQRKTKAFTS